MAATLLKHSSADSRSSLSVLLSAVTNSAITDLSCRGESSGSLLATDKSDIGPVLEAVLNAKAAIDTGEVVPEPTLLIPFDETETF